MSAGTIHQQLDQLYRSESGRIRATLIRLLGDFDLAEDAVQDAFAAALRRWPEEGLPANPVSWLISAGRFKAVDVLRRRARQDAAREKLAALEVSETPGPSGAAGAVGPVSGENALTAADGDDAEEIADDRLRLIFVCCHPALAPEARLALTLREVCGLTTEEIARAFLTNPSTLAQRIVRAKARIRSERIPWQVPPLEELPERLDAVLRVIYLVFNEGYAASSGEELTRPDLSGEAIRLGRLLLELLPEPEAAGLLALMLLQESRRAARISGSGELILLDQQDRALWDRGLIAEGIELVERALKSRRFGSRTLQAAIAAVHAESPDAASTDWAQIAALYGLLARVEPSPVVELNRAVAVSMRDGPEAGLVLVEKLLSDGFLGDYAPAHAARADFCRRLGRRAEARESWQRALALTRQEPERRFYRRRLAETGD